MKITIEQNLDTENEIVLRCREIDQEMLEVLSLLNMRNKKILGQKDMENHLIEPWQVLYGESVDAMVFLYTEKDVFKTTHNLAELENAFGDVGFFRCSKSMIINLNAISSFKSQMGNRIDATLKNGEHIIISRHYAKLLREKLELQ